LPGPKNYKIKDSSVAIGVAKRLELTPMAECDMCEFLVSFYPSNEETVYVNFLTFYDDVEINLSNDDTIQLALLNGET
jgi:hypothetical protein